MRRFNENNSRFSLIPRCYVHFFHQFYQASERSLFYEQVFLISVDEGLTIFRFIFYLLSVHSSYSSWLATNVEKNLLHLSKISLFEIIFVYMNFISFDTGIRLLKRFLSVLFQNYRYYVNFWYQKNPRSARFNG